ncbi:MAG: mechanosensitive ion channel [Desulfobulbaceae bacterium]|nr:mechanosensitive ion channel [Desulfobulbaceae bacterium]
MTINHVVNSVNEIIANIVSSAAAFFPRLFWALVLAGVGWLAAWILKQVTLKMVTGLDQLFLKKVEQKGLPSVQIKHRYGPFLGEAVFWTSFLFFFLLAIQILQLELLSAFLQNALNYLPHLAIAIVLVVTSFFIGSISRHLVSKALQAMKVEQADLLGNLVKVAVVFMGLLLGVDQIGVDVGIINTFVSISLAAGLGAIALAFGIGSKTYVENTISSVQIRRIYQSGDTVMIDSVEGEIVEITSTLVFLQSPEGQISLPAKLFLEKTSLLKNPLEKNEA